MKINKIPLPRLENPSYPLRHRGFLIHLYKVGAINRRTFTYFWERATTW